MQLCVPFDEWAFQPSREPPNPTPVFVGEI
jgi:hypothetical protein